MSSNIYLLVLLSMLSLLLLISGAYSAQDFGYLNVTSEPKYARIFLGKTYANSFLSMTPTTELLRCKPGEYEIRLNKGGYKDFRKRIAVRRGQVLEIGVELAKENSAAPSKLTKEKPVEAYITIRSRPSGADVYLDGQRVKKTPMIDYPVIAQTGKEIGSLVEIRKDGYETHTEVIDWAELKDRIRIHLGEVALKEIRKDKPLEPTRPGLDRQPILSMTIVIMFSILLVVIGMLIALIIVKLRHLQTREATAKKNLAGGDTFGKYKILEELGRGGMSVVYKAQHSVLGRLVALKIPYQNMLRDRQSANQFLQEGQLGAKLHHPHIIRILDHGEVAGTPYLATELINGESLEVLIQREAPLTIGRASLIIIQVCEALDYAHSKQVLHRDVKPGNIMLSGSGDAKVMDFGIALVKSLSMHNEGETVWISAYYRFPEEEVTAASDLYSLGIVFYEMITGRVPFSDGSLRDIIKQHKQKEPVNPKLYNPLIPADVQAVVMKLLRKDPKARFQEASEVINALSRFRR